MAQAEIYIDAQGRRRVDRSKQTQGPPAPDPEIAALKAELAALKAKVDRIDEDLQCFEITGDNGVDVDGNGPKDIVVKGPAQNGSGIPAGSEWFAVELCDGTTGEVVMRNRVPP